MTIQAAHYADTEKALMEHPIIIHMFNELPVEIKVAAAFHPQDLPDGFSMSARRRFLDLEAANPDHRWTEPMHIGAPAGALRRLCKQTIEATWS